MKKVLACFVLIFSLIFSVSCKDENQKDISAESNAKNDVSDNQNIKNNETSKNEKEGLEILPLGNFLPEKLYAYTVASEYFCDLNGDEEDEKITLYTDAKKEDGELLLNDGNNWSFVVFDKKENLYYMLFDGYVQLGNINFQIADYFEDGKATTEILLYKMWASGIEILKFNAKDENKFYAETVYNSSSASDGGINMKYSSFPLSY